MPDTAPDLDFCHQCGEFAEVVRRKGYPWCEVHAPVYLRAGDYDLIYEKAQVDGPHHKGWFSRIFRV